MKEKSLTYWFFGLFGVAFIVFVIVLLIALPEPPKALPLMIFSIAIYAIGVFFLIRKARRIDLKNRNALEKGIRIQGTITNHSRSFNIFSSTRYYVVNIEIQHEGKLVSTKIKSTKSSTFDHFPIGSSVDVLYDSESGAIIVE